MKLLMFMPKLLPCKDAGVSDPSQRREVASAAMIIGLLMGVVGAMWWHVFVVPQFDLAGFAASTESTAVAFEVGYLVQFYEPAPAWLPTAVVFPVSPPSRSVFSGSAVPGMFPAVQLCRSGWKVVWSAAVSASVLLRGQHSPLPSIQV